MRFIYNRKGQQRQRLTKINIKSRNIFDYTQRVINNRVNNILECYNFKNDSFEITKNKKIMLDMQLPLTLSHKVCKFKSYPENLEISSIFWKFFFLTKFLI